MTANLFPEWSDVCLCCPRQCHVSRRLGQAGYCRTTGVADIASICVHHGEEPVLGGAAGVCNVFFASCNLQCRYCQNFQISRHDRPAAQAPYASWSAAAGAIRAHLAHGVRAVGFVSPSHMLQPMSELQQILAAAGDHPVYIYNSNGYDRPEMLERLSGRIQIYLPDLKYADARLAAEWSGAPDYPSVARIALKEMHRQTGDELVLDADGLALSGLIVRHLVLPGEVENSKQVLRFIARELSPRVHVSIMSQYSPNPGVQSDPRLGRSVTPDEYAEVIAELDRLGLENGWVQELSSPGHYAPDFTRPHPFEA